MASALCQYFAILTTMSLYFCVKQLFDELIKFYVCSLPYLNRKVIIVSVFGKSQYRAKGCKADMFSSVLQVDLLEEPNLDKESLVGFILCLVVYFM